VAGRNVPSAPALEEEGETNREEDLVSDDMRDKRLRPEQVERRLAPDEVEKRGMVSDVVVPIAQSVAGGGAGGLAGAWAAQKLGGQNQPPPKKDD
jgi:hypothetical protein